MKFKLRYLLIIIILVLIGVVVGGKALYSPLGENTRLDKVIQISGVFVALLTAVTALAVADREKRQVNVNIKPVVDKKHEEKYIKNEITESLQQDYKDFDDPIKSYRVQFKMVNTSGFTLIKPALTFRLPLQRQHPQKVAKPKGLSVVEEISTRNFRSNLFNSQSELRVLEFADTRILSNSNLPYWNNQDEITIWIRMALNDANLKPFTVEVSVNCENADGVTKKVDILPKKLLGNI